MDFVSDQLVNGTRFRVLTIVDVYTREVLAFTVGKRLRAEDVVQVCNKMVARRRPLVRVFVDNGGEFSGRILDLWACRNNTKIDFNRPGKPTDNCFIESFNGSFRDECLNVHWFETIDDAALKIEAWRDEYNESGPHEALKQSTPSEHARKCRAMEWRGVLPRFHGLLS